MSTINITQIKLACREAAQEYLQQAEYQATRETSKNRFVKWSGHDRKREALRVAHQLMEFADGRRGLIAKAIKQHKQLFQGKRKTPMLINMGGCGAKVGGYIHHRGTQPQVVLAINRDFTADVHTETYRKADWNYGD